MSDEHDSAPLPGLTSEQEETVRRLLSEARHEDPLPAEIGDRLDRVLADLSSSSPSRPAPVDLAARRRRRNAGRLLVAAAAVIVGGVAVGQMIGGNTPDSASDSAGSSVERGPSVSGQAGGQAEDQAGGDDSGGAPAPGGAKARPLRLTSQNLERDVQRQLRRSSANADPEPGASSLAPSYDTDPTCASVSSTPYGAGTLFAALYDGVPAVLALRPPDGDTQQAQVLECGTGTPLQSVIVPVP